MNEYTTRHLNNFACNNFLCYIINKGAINYNNLFVLGGENWNQKNFY